MIRYLIISLHATLLGAQLLLWMVHHLNIRLRACSSLKFLVPKILYFLPLFQYILTYLHSFIVLKCTNELTYLGLIMCGWYCTVPVPVPVRLHIFLFFQFFFCKDIYDSFVDKNLKKKKDGLWSCQSDPYKHV